MAAFAEGLNIIEHASIGGRTHVVDAETSPLREPELYQYEFDIPAITEVWRRGSVVCSWLLDLTAAALCRTRPREFSGRVSDSGEGRWTVDAAIDEGVPAPVLTAALFARFASRGEDEYANKLLSAMRSRSAGTCSSSVSVWSARAHVCRSGCRRWCEPRRRGEKAGGGHESFAPAMIVPTSHPRIVGSRRRAGARAGIRDATGLDLHERQPMPRSATAAAVSRECGQRYAPLRGQSESSEPSSERGGPEVRPDQ